MTTRLLAFMAVGILLSLCPTSTLAQSKNKVFIKAVYKDKPLNLVLLDLKVNHRLEFEIDQSLIENKRISVDIQRAPLEEAMRILLAETELSFKIQSDRRVLIFEQSEREAQEEVIPKSTAKPEQFDFTLSGQVKDQDTGETLPFASLLVKENGEGTTTNVDGYFTLFNVPSDTAVIEVSYLGYQTKNIRLSPELASQAITVGLASSTNQLREVEVVSNRKEQLIKASAGVSTIGVTPAQLSTLPSFGEKDIFRSLQLIPGVSGTNESSSGLFVRGGTPDQNLVLFDGFTVYHVDHLFGFFSAFNSNAIKDVQLYKGGFEAKYGGRLSSVVELTGKDGNTESFNAGMGLSLLSYNGFVEAPFADGKGSILLAGRRSFQSNFYNNLFDAFTDTGSAPAGAPQGGLGGRFGLTEVQPNSYFYDLNAKLSYRLAKDNFSLSFYNGQDNLDNSRNIDQNSFSGGLFGNRFGGNTNNNLTFNSNNTDLTNWGNWGTSLKWSRRWTSRWYSNLHLSYSNYYSERDRSNETTVNRSDTSIIRNNGSYELNDLKDYTLKFDNELALSGNNQLEFGIQATFNDIEYDFTQNDTISVISRADQGLITTAYIQDRYTINNQLILSGGLRLSHYELTNELYWEPRASFTYLLTDQWKAKGAWGRFYQFANRIVREDIQQGSRDFWLLADDSQIPIGFSQHFIAGLSFETPNYLFDVEGYYKQLDGLSEYSTRFIPSGFGPNQQLNYEEFFYQGDGIAQGLEFLLQKKSGTLTGWLSYTLGQVKYDFPIFGEEPFFANQDQTHELKLIGNYKYKRWDFSATFIYATGKPYTAPTGFYEVPLLDGTSADFFEVSDKNALRLPDYHRLDLAATYNFKMWDGPATLGLSVFNLYNRGNIWYKEYEVIEGELIETNITLLDLTPSLFFTYQLK